jgi:hypothetical protein
LIGRWGNCTSKNAPQVISDDRIRINIGARFVPPARLRSAQNLIKAALVTFSFNERQKCPSKRAGLCFIFGRLLAGKIAALIALERTQ